ncbi:MAG: cadherin-like domain-containing protein [Pirellulales bacterium]|nr:cadherin-like domain-containing protein [Pirellulales bacterium]
MEPLEQRFVLSSVLGGDPDTAIAGTVYNDLNANGVRDQGEDGIPNWTVYLDLNQNGVQDKDLDGNLEPSVLTNVDGDYLLSGLLAGNYRIAETVQSGWSATAPDFQDVEVVDTHETKADFFNVRDAAPSTGGLAGAAWNDLNGDGIRATDPLTGAPTDPGLANWTVYVDLNHDGTSNPGEPSTLTDLGGEYSFAGLTAGDYVVRIVVPGGWEVSPGYDDNYTVNVVAGEQMTIPDFANYSVSAGAVGGTVWDDANGNGSRDVDPLTGAFTEPGLAGRTIFADLNLNGAADTGEPAAVSGADGSYLVLGVRPGYTKIVELPGADWRPTRPSTASYSITLLNGQTTDGLDFGNQERSEAGIRGVLYHDADQDRVRDPGERGLAGITVYLDLDGDGALDADEPSTVSASDLFFTPAADEAGSYSFTHLAKGDYTVREVVPELLSSTPDTERAHVVTVGPAEDRGGVDLGNVYRPNEIRGVKFEDTNGNRLRDAGEPGIAGVTIFIDLDRDDVRDPDEPTTATGADGSYSFAGLTPGAYVVREILGSGYVRTFPTTTGGILWPAGVSNPAVGNMSPSEITISLADGESSRQNVSLTLPGSGALTNLVDVFLLFDDTGSFTANSPIVRAAFPDIIASLQASLPGIDLGFGVGRFEEYGNFAAEYAVGRPFVLNQPIVAASTFGFAASIQAALDRTAPGYGGDEPETVFEALYQTVTGLGFDGNNNGSVLDSGAAGLVSTQLSPGNSGDVPSFPSFTADATGSVLPAAGVLGGAGFRAGALPVILTATDTGFAFEPKGETAITGVGGLTLPISALTQTSRPTTPFSAGAGIQQTITGLNALGALVIGLGTNPQPTVDPRQGLEAIAKLTGAVNRSTATIDNGTPDPIAPGDPFYFQISSGFGASVASGVVAAIQNAVTSVAVDLTIQASDPRVHIVNHTGTLSGVGAGQTATFDVEFVGDGIPHRFDLQFVRQGTNVVLGSIPVVIGTPIPGDGYEFEDLEDGEYGEGADFGCQPESLAAVNVAPSFTAGSDLMVLEDAGSQTIAHWATAISPGPAIEASQSVSFLVSNDNQALFIAQPAISSDGTLAFTSASNAFGTAVVTVEAKDDGGTANGGNDTSDPRTFTITVAAVNDAPTAADDSCTLDQDTVLVVPVASCLLANDVDVDGDPMTAVLVGGPSHGTVMLNADGSFSYTPIAGYFGPDTFTYSASDGAMESNPATVSIQVRQVAPLGATKFIVADPSAQSTFQYDAAGNPAGRLSLNGENQQPRGVASNKDGSLRWVVDAKGVVFVYDDAGRAVGRWEARGLDKPEGIATDGSDVWIVDRGTDRVYFFDQAALRRSGRARPTSSFPLSPGNRQPADVVTDGAHLWVVNNSATVDRVFRYGLNGRLEGSWRIDPANATPTGLTIDPNHVDHIWIVDAGTDSVYQYDGAAGRISGAQSASSLFALGPANRNPQGIADPMPKAGSGQRVSASDAAFALLAAAQDDGGSANGAKPRKPSGPDAVEELLWLMDITPSARRRGHDQAIREFGMGE